MDLQTEFDKLVKDWKVHCEKNCFSSIMSIFYDCEAVRKIIALGYSALPLIQEELSVKHTIPYGFLWRHVVYSIVPELEIPEEMRGKVNEIEAFTLQWLNNNIHRFAHPTP
ncbi:MAG: hypothetical protein PHN19_01940 [Patescibacteria group bacterium]|nr:hypothetical protein [Patescibacteria group bacterium]